MKSIIIARVSTEEQKEAGNSLPVQIVRLKQYCERKGFEVIKEFSFDESAFKDQRTEFDSILEFVINSKEKLVVCFDKVDRLSRNVFDKRVSVLYEKALSDEIELHFVSDGQVINDKISAVEKFQFGINLGLAKYYSDAISDNVKRAQEQKLRKGEILGPAPYGYRNITKDDGNKWVEKDEYEQSVVKVIYSMYVTGVYSVDVIKALLKTDYNTKLTRGKIYKILTNKFYHGYMTYKGVDYEHYYGKTIELEDYQKALEVREGKTRPGKTGQKYGSLNHIYKGFIKCSYCGCSITAEQKKGKYVYYHCTDYHKKHKQNNVKVNYIEEKILTEEFAKMFKGMQIPENKLQEITDTLKVSHNDKKEFYEAEFEKLTSEYKKYEKMRETLYDDYASGSITIDVQVKRDARYSNEQEKIEIRLKQFRQADDQYYITATTVLSVASRSYELFKSSKPNKKREILRLVLSNCTLKDENLCYDLKEPFQTILTYASCSEWLRG